MPYCRKCGRRLGADIEFCPKCGTPVVVETVREVVKAPKRRTSVGAGIFAIVLGFFFIMPLLYTITNPLYTLQPLGWLITALGFILIVVGILVVLSPEV